MIISMIAAMSENRVIGWGGKLPWSIPADLSRFRSITMGHPVLMGRKTFQAIGHPLAGRTNIVLSRTVASIEGCIVAPTLEEAIAAAGDAEEIFICGGGELYREALPLAQRIYLTVIHHLYQGDVVFPELPEQFLELEREEFSDATPPCSFIVYEKVAKEEPLSDAEELFRKGMDALQRELYYLARCCFEQAASLQETPLTISHLAFALAKSRGDFPTALNLAQRALEHEPDHPTLLLNLGRIQLLAGAREAGLQTLRKGVQRGGGAPCLAELSKYGDRRPPLFARLPRSHPLNRYLGLVLNRMGFK